jgi:beta-lactam-binding protein with PASTA domain
MRRESKFSSKVILFNIVFLSITALVLGLSTDKAHSIDLIPNTPNVVGMKPSEAVKKLDDRCHFVQIDVNPRGIEDPSKHGIVLDQNPEAGENCYPHQSAIVGAGVLLVKVPNLFSKLITDAMSELHKVGLEGKDKGWETNPWLPCDMHARIIRQEPISGTEQFPGTTINLWKGECRVSVPNLEGLLANTAKTRLQEVNLYYTWGGYEVTHDPNNTLKVIRQEPQAHSYVHPHTRVNVWTGKWVIRAPNVIGKTPSTAEQLLREAGFLNVTQEEATISSPFQKLGRVIGQEPKAGPVGEEVKGPARRSALIYVGVAPKKVPTRMPSNMKESKSNISVPKAPAASSSARRLGANPKPGLSSQQSARLQAPSVPKVTVPNVVGKSLVEAVGLLQRAKAPFKVMQGRKELQVASLSKEQAKQTKVMKQEPKAGAALEPNKPVVLYVSAAPKPSAKKLLTPRRR